MKKINIVALPCSVVEDLLPKVLSNQASRRSAELVNAHLNGSASDEIIACKSCSMIRDVIVDELDSAGRDRHKGAAPFEMTALNKMRIQLHAIQWSVLVLLFLFTGALYISPHVRALLLLVPFIGALGYLFTRKVWTMPLASLIIPLSTALMQYFYAKQAVSLPFYFILFAVLGTAWGVLVGVFASIAFNSSGLFHSRYVRARRTLFQLVSGFFTLLLIAACVYTFIIPIIDFVLPV